MSFKKNNENKKLLYVTEKRNIKRQNIKERLEYGRPNFFIWWIKNLKSINKRILNIAWTSTTKNWAFYVTNSKTVVKDRLRKYSNGVFVINSTTTTTFLPTRRWWGIRWQTCKFLILIQRRSCPDDHLCMVGVGSPSLTLNLKTIRAPSRPLARLSSFAVFSSPSCPLVSPHSLFSPRSSFCFSHRSAPIPLSSRGITKNPNPQKTQSPHRLGSSVVIIDANVCTQLA